MIKEIGSSASYDLQFYNFFFPLKNQYKKKSLIELFTS